jgi:RNA-directed DNA polymerase
VRHSSYYTGGRGGRIKTPSDLQDLRRKIYTKAKADTAGRFWGLFVHVCNQETLHEA